MCVGVVGGVSGGLGAGEGCVGEVYVCRGLCVCLGEGRMQCV